MWPFGMQKVCFQTLICHLLRTGKWRVLHGEDTAGVSGSEAMFFICINYVDYVLSRLQIFL
jgi:hypothetical protein